MPHGTLVAPVATLMNRRPPARPIDPERGAALVVSLICVVGLLGIGAITLLSVQSELRSSGSSRVEQTALYAAESGVAAGMDYLRVNCKDNGDFFSDLVEPSNVNPASPAHPSLYGNNRRPNTGGNPFDADTENWYQVTILNNRADPGYDVGNDVDGDVLLHVIGYGPNGTQATLEVEVRATSCIATFCAIENAQRNINARNDATQVCSEAVDPGRGTRTIALP